MAAGALTSALFTIASDIRPARCCGKSRRTICTERCGDLKRDIRVAHSPDSDDAFMFYALATRKIDTGDINYVHSLSDIETLNRKAMEGEFEVSAVSFHAYAYISARYALMSCGASMGRNYGPIVVATRSMQPKALADKVVAIPGALTTAFLALRLFQPD